MAVIHIGVDGVGEMIMIYRCWELVVTCFLWRYTNDTDTNENVLVALWLSAGFGSVVGSELVLFWSMFCWCLGGGVGRHSDWW